MNKIQHILIVDDHPAMAYGTKFILEQEENIQVVGVATTGEMGVEMMVELNPSIIFLDFHLPDLTGMEVAVKMRELNKDVQIVIFTGIDYMPILNNLLELGVCGIMSKDSSEDQIRNMMRALKEGQSVIPISLLHQMRLSHPDDDLSSLTDEEINIMNQIVKGATNEQIADEIHMSKRSVDNYVRKIYDKFGVKSRAQAIEKFLQIKR
ncbi:DNA-binding response regulator [Paenibacillus chitinolyticus]|uniref:DNA-binding response regulator n=1 Tax=Paenibacillus chitinolyticus TaxID=79263 RepID=A0A410WTR7_9BACL|nr:MULTISPECIES: response regulator transcription factor [Paenibacillus]MCY9593143.1 response regulator transcription factor [Paenibacillus chitinolyticus]MCY9599023.1 response regulator transcription factor [Paenibacillus chitinolyticus]QAV17724.1 DNA-binding response regulator [Paenibacillus chitinolyticus]